MINEKIINALLNQNTRSYLMARNDYSMHLLNEYKKTDDLDKKYNYNIFQSVCCAYERDKGIQDFLINFLFVHEKPVLVLFLKRYKIDTTIYKSYFAAQSHGIIEDGLMDILLKDYDKKYGAIFLEKEIFQLNQDYIAPENIELNKNKLLNKYTCLERALIEENESIIKGYQNYLQYFKKTIANIDWSSPLIDKLKLEYHLSANPPKTNQFKI